STKSTFIFTHAPSTEIYTLSLHDALPISLLDFRPHAATSYAYRMAGFDEDWTEIPPGSLPTAIYTNLPHGSYTLELRADTHGMRSEEHTSELQSRENLVCRLLLEKKKKET